jgi:hypothetical protein
VFPQLLLLSTFSLLPSLTPVANLPDGGVLDIYSGCVWLSCYCCVLTVTGIPVVVSFPAIAGVPVIASYPAVAQCWRPFLLQAYACRFSVVLYVKMLSVLGHLKNKTQF